MLWPISRNSRVPFEKCQCLGLTEVQLNLNLWDKFLALTFFIISRCESNVQSRMRSTAVARDLRLWETRRWGYIRQYPSFYLSSHRTSLWNCFSHHWDLQIAVSILQTYYRGVETWLSMKSRPHVWPYGILKISIQATEATEEKQN